MTISDFLMIAATALSPLIAVQVTQWLKAQSDVRDRKIWIFKTLMATRAQQLSPSHVQALNSISLEFSARNKKEKPILDVWQQYLDHLGTQMDPAAWLHRKVELLVEFESPRLL